MNKKGAELPLSTMIIAIIVIVVLVVIIAFFLSGTYSLKQAISRIFYGTTSGTDKALAVQICQQNCDVAMSLPEGQVRTSSQYCNQYFNIDTVNRGESDFVQIGGIGQKFYVRYYCSSDATSGKVYTAGSTTAPSDAIKDLGINCGFSCSTGK
jgi:hypothetical protein